jgi:hypothetical protein
MRLRLPEPSRRVTLTLTLVLVGLSVALLAAAAFAPDDSSAPAPAPRPPAREVKPGPLVTEIRTDSPVGRFERATCRIRRHTVENPSRWFHPTGNFYPPGGDAPTRADLDHLAVRDGAVIVTYRASLRRPARDALKRWAATGIGVVVAPAATSSPLEAYTADRRLMCDGTDLDRLTEFTDRHFSKPIDLEPHGNTSQ